MLYDVAARAQGELLRRHKLHSPHPDGPTGLVRELQVQLRANIYKDAAFHSETHTWNIVFQQLQHKYPKVLKYHLSGVSSGNYLLLLSTVSLLGMWQ